MPKRKINEEIDIDIADLTELEIAVIYAFGKKTKWAKTAKLPLPYFYKLFKHVIRKEVKITLERLGRRGLFNIYKKGNEKMMQISGIGFKVALRVKDYIER